MNIKKCSLKTMCAALACTTVLSSMLAAYATNTTVYETPMDDSVGTESIETLANDSAGADPSDAGWTTEENSFEEIKVTYQQSSSYTVTIPKAITLGTNKQAVYSVKVAGNIDANQRVYVAPVDGIAGGENLDFYMKDLSGKKEDVVATVTQNKTYWSSENVANAYEETNNSVSAPDLTAGTWEGTFQVEIRLESNTIHEEEEPDPYDVAPENAYLNWDYTLDNENDIIILNYYKGSETDVIVYANYVIGDRTYKTKLSSNANGATHQTPYMFNGYRDSRIGNIRTIKFSKNIDSSNVTDMSYMFYYCEKLKELDTSGFDTSNVTNMSNMFGRNLKLENIDVSNFDTSKVTNMSWMFYQCAAITGLDVSNFDTSNVTDMSNMFGQCNALVSLDLSNFDTSKVTNMQGMFQQSYGGYSSLRSLDVSSFDTSNVTNMMQMFRDCEFLTSLDLSSFDTSNVTDMTYMFYNDPELKTIYASQGKWSTTKANTSNMFSGCGTSEVTYK